jgi:hypothetical protein
MLFLIDVDVAEYEYELLEDNSDGDVDGALLFANASGGVGAVVTNTTNDEGNFGSNHGEDHDEAALESTTTLAVEMHMHGHMLPAASKRK